MPESSDALKLLFVSLGFNIDEKQLKKAETRYTELKSKLDLVVGAARQAWSAVRTLTADVAGDAIRVRSMASQLGITTDVLQELQHAANVTQSSAEAMNRGLLQLARNAYLAANGSKESARAFHDLGVQVFDGEGKIKATSDLVYEIADAFRRMPDTTEKAAVAMVLFGRTGAELIPTLNQGADAIVALGHEGRELGAIFDAEAIAAAGRFDEAADTLTAALKGLRNVIGVDLLPVIIKLLKSTIEWIRENRALIRLRVHQAVMLFATAVRVLKQFLDPMLTVLRFLVSNTVAFAAVLGILAALMIGKAALAVGSLVLWLGKLSAAHMGAAAAAMAQNAAVLLLGLKWLALGAIIALVAEDIFTFLVGGDSMLGRLINKVRDLESALWQAFIAPHDGDWWPIAKVREFARWLDRLATENPIAFSVLRTIFGSGYDLMTGKVFLKGATALKGIVQGARGEEYSPDVRAAFFGGGAASPVAAAQTAKASAPRGPVSLQSNVTVHAQTNASPQDIANAVRPVVQDELQSVIREAQAQTE